MSNRFNELYDYLVLNDYIEHIGYNTPYTACGCDDVLWDKINKGYGGLEDILLAAKRAGRVNVLIGEV